VLWAQDQVVAYTWRSGQVPPAWLASAIDAAAVDVGLSRRSRAATFVRTAGAASLIAYGEPTGCSPAGLACFDRSGAPTSFKMWFRAHGYRFDWGTLRWCQALTTISNGCYDVENITLDEFGHVDILGHHVNLPDNSDYLDAVVQTYARARADPGWAAHVFARCDVARLQLEYDRRNATDLFSTCLAIPTVTGLAADLTSVVQGDSVRFTATLRTSSGSANRALAGDPVSGRAIVLQKRASSSAPWVTVGTMAPASATDGTYTAWVGASLTYEWRAAFAQPTDEGLLGSSSGVVTVTVIACRLPRATCIQR
jgi:hypothetical protein